MESLGPRDYKAKVASLFLRCFLCTFVYIHVRSLHLAARRSLSIGGVPCCNIKQICSYRVFLINLVLVRMAGCADSKDVFYAL